MERSILKQYLKYHWGYPGREGAETNEEWESIINRMIELLNNMDVDKYPKRDANTSTVTTYYTEQNDFLENNKKEFFELYSKWFYNLWD